MVVEHKPIWKSKTVLGIALLAIAFFAESNGYTTGLVDSILETLGWGTFGVGIIDKIQTFLEKKK